MLAGAVIVLTGLPFASGNLPTGSGSSSMRVMKIFVTGGAGYIGSICVEQMLDQGHKVIVLDNLSEGHRAAVDPRAEFHELDLADRAKLFPLLEQTRPDAVMHFAANALVSPCALNSSASPHAASSGRSQNSGSGIGRS